MICSPCLSDLHEFCRDDVRECDCDCCRWQLEVEASDDFDDDDWQLGQDRYERQLDRERD